MHSFKTLSIALLVLMSQLLYAQGQISIKIPSKVPVSADAASLAKYVDYPVDYSVGLVDISIPIYEIKTGDLVLPINLSYHSAGLKPRDPSGWVGTNWTLNAEPSISRNVNGLPDDKPIVGYMYNDYNDNALGYGKDYFRQLANAATDEEPDAFYYKLLSARGSFYLNRKYESLHSMVAYHGFVTQPFSPLVINPGQNLDSFNIRDENGIYYDFGGTNSQEYAGNRSAITRWLCNYVQGAATAARINFSYYPANGFAFSVPMTNGVTVEDQSWANPHLTETTNGASTGYHIGGDGTKTWDPSGDSFSFNSSTSYSSVSETKLHEINFDNGRIVFIKSNQNTLSSVIVYDKEGNLIKQMDFFVTRFHPATELTKLDSIQIRGNGTKTISYVFEYESTGSVPAMLTNSIDHWGFYNAMQNTGTVPYGTISSEVLSSPTISHEIGTGNRESNYIAALCGNLKTIVSPEGVITHLLYEPNKYGYISHPVNDIPIFITGGLRVSQITVQDMKEPSFGYIRAFEYGEIIHEEQEKIKGDWGVPKHKVTINDYGYSRNKIAVGSQSTATSRLRIFGSNPVKSISYNNGSSVMYGTVTEKYIALSDGKKLITKRRYHVPDGYAVRPSVAEIDDVPFDRDPKSDFNYGQLISEEKLKDEGVFVDGEAVYTPVSKTEYTWSHHKTHVTDYTDNCTMGVGNYPYPCMDGSIHFGTAYDANIVSTTSINFDPTLYENFIYKEWNLDNGCMKVDREVATTYASGTPFVTTKEYTYNDNSNHMLPVKITTTTSDNSVKEEEFSYAEEMTLNEASIPDPEDLGQYMLLQNKSIMNLLQQTVKKNGTVQSSRMKYNGNRPELVKTKGTASEAYETRTNYHTYDNYGNIAETSSQGGPHTCYLWSYNSQSPIVKIENANYSEVITALGQTFIDQLRLKTIPSSTDLQQLNSLRSLLPASLISTYTYKPLVGVSSITDPKGEAIYYEYDGWGNLKRTYTKDLDGNGQLQENTRKYYEYNNRTAH